jgi:DNA polymerase-3 subunit epsilon
MYAVLDVETTGLNAKTDRITEISVYIHDGENIVDHFESLVNPCCRIPYHISGMTGITDKLVEDAPTFPEIAKRIVEMTEGTTIVAHNASFDYNFLRYEFKRLFYDFRKKTLCTKKLSRKLLPDMESYGLGKLCKALKIPNHARHRAGGDALATVRLLEYLLEKEKEPENISLKENRSSIPYEEIEKLPEVPGVYYFHDEDGNILYIGKSVNIRQRVLTHLNNNLTKRAIEMRDRARHLSYEETGSDLVAQLLESNEIKKYRPLFNKSQRRTLFTYGLFSHTGKDGYIRLSVEKIRGDTLPLTAYGSGAEGRNHLVMLINQYDLCQKLCGLYKTKHACFHHQIGECKGACTGKEPADEYNNRVIDAISRYAYHNRNFFIIDEGRNAEEMAVVKIENGRYMGYGYIDMHALNGDISVLHDTIKKYEDNRDIQIIIRGYMRKNEFEKLIIY